MRSIITKVVERTADPGPRPALCPHLCTRWLRDQPQLSGKTQGFSKDEQLPYYYHGSTNMADKSCQVHTDPDSLPSFAEGFSFGH